MQVTCMSDGIRIEHDTLGEVKVPEDALWGAQTQRAVENFPISGFRMSSLFIKVLGALKRSCANANVYLNRLPADIGHAINLACDEIITGQLDGHFPVDVFQTGSGTSTNMNMNEVIANRANQLLHQPSRVHPNDHVNMSQSSNDVIPTAIHAAVTVALREQLLPSLEAMAVQLRNKSQSFNNIVKTGRTHLQDATPIRLGQVFSGYESQIQHSVVRVQACITALRDLPLGGTAVGTGINCPVGFPALAIANLNRVLDADFTEASNHIEANASRDALVEVSGQLRTIAVSVHKIANDIRWMASGPRNGLGELRLPAVQPGSSIMPGKVNPVMAEALIMACAQIIGYDVANTMGGLGGYFELNLMMPLLAHNLLNGIRILANAIQAFTLRCLAELEADIARCEETVERNLALATALVPVLGYEKAAAIAKEAECTGKTVREVACAWQVLTEEELKLLLDPRRMTE
jgi:fumarate hydratase class II